MDALNSVNKNGGNLGLVNSNYILQRLISRMRNLFGGNRYAHSQFEFEKMQKELSRQEAIIYKMASDLSDVRLTFARYLLDSLIPDRAYNLPTFAQIWKQVMYRRSAREWIAATYALLHLLETSKAPGARSAIRILASPESVYDENIGAIRRANGQNLEKHGIQARKFQRAHKLLLSKLAQDSNVHSKD